MIVRRKLPDQAPAPAAAAVLAWSPPRPMPPEAQSGDLATLAAASLKSTPDSIQMENGAQDQP